MHAYGNHRDGASCNFLCRRIHSRVAGSPKLQKDITDFDQDLALQLENLMPKESDGTKILKLSWLSRVLAVALKKHTDAVNLIPRETLPLFAHEEKWMNDYMDQTARMLDICSSLAGALSNIEQGQVHIRHACHILSDAGNVSTKEEAQSSCVPPVVISEAALARAHKALQEWLNLQGLIEQRTPKCYQRLKEMIENLRPPRDHDLSKGKGFLLALYGANAAAVFAFYVLSLALFREGELLSLTLLTSPAASWSASISCLVQLAKDEAAEKNNFDVCVEDMSVLYSTVRNMMALIEQLHGLCESKDGSVIDTERRSLVVAVRELCSQMDENAEGLKLLSKALHSMLKAIVSSRSALLEQLGNFGIDDW